MEKHNLKFIFLVWWGWWRSGDIHSPEPVELSEHSTEWRIMSSDTKPSKGSSTACKSWAGASAPHYTALCGAVALWITLHCAMQMILEIFLQCLLKRSCPSMNCVILRDVKPWGPATIFRWGRTDNSSRWPKTDTFHFQSKASLCRAAPVPRKWDVYLRFCIMFP